jgi:hypothetical protein
VAHFERIGDDVGIRRRDRQRILDEVLDAVEEVDAHLGASGCDGPVSRAAERAVLEAAGGLR